jgi:hypothetical protein
MAGRATSLLGFIQHGIGALVSITLGFIADGSTPIPMGICILAASLFAFISLIIRFPQTTLKAK